jgi:branched-chain amino acid aminotransferase
LEELGTSNIFAVTDNGVYTPALTDTILPGITRDSVIKYLKSRGQNVVETTLKVQDIVDWYNSGSLREMFVTGTAATLTNIKVININEKEYEIGDDGGSLSKEILQFFRDLKAFRIPDEFGWMERLESAVSAE